MKRHGWNTSSDNARMTHTMVDLKGLKVPCKYASNRKQKRSSTCVGMENQRDGQNYQVSLLSGPATH